MSACAARSWSWPSALVGDRYSARARGSVANARQDGQLIGQRLARRGAGAEDDVAAVVGEIGRLELVRPRRGDSAIMERAHHIRVGPVRPRLRPCLPRRQVGDMAQRILLRIGAIDRAGEQLAAEIRHRLPSCT